ncbi:MAG: hypothetical protein L6R40_006708 [Gallowayella cf. fulva]|nr:MAG: hypothetical protein L6R40_006708 [Xanthomendoza cf. fulva]
MRTKRWLRVWGDQDGFCDSEDDPVSQNSSPDFALSSRTTAYSINTTAYSIHEHNFECRTLSTPADPDAYAMLRRACLQVLSGEHLPRGLHSGRVYIEDPVNGLITAFLFALSDPHARGGQRHYALLAVAKPGSSRVMEASSSIWPFFENLVNKLKEHTEQQLKRRGCLSGGNLALDVSNVSSFLTGRTVDPDGFPRHGGINIRARSLAEMSGDELIFPWIHQQLELLLAYLATRFGDLLVEPEK